MARQANDSLFLEELLRSNSGTSNNSNSSSSITTSHSSLSSARAIIQAWAELRDSFQHQSFQPNHLQALKILLQYKTSLHVAEPQAKLLISILSSQNIFLPLESYPLLFRLLYIWVRKSFRPSLALVDSAVEVLSKRLHNNFDAKRNPELFAEAVLLLGAFAFVPSATETSKTVCLELLCRLLDEYYKLVSSVDGLIPNVLAGIGYALCSSVNAYYVRILDAFFGIWGKEDGPHGNVSHGLMILHLVDWIIFGFIKLRSDEKLHKFAHGILENPKPNYVPFALVMAAAGALRALNRSVADAHGLEIVSRLRISAENQIELVAQGLIADTGGFSIIENDYKTSLLLQCISLALARCGLVSSRASLLISIASALLLEIFPLRRLYTRILELNHDSPGMMLGDVKEHLNSLSFKEAGTISGVFCNQYVSIDEENKVIVENMVWHFCRELYLGHRQVTLVLHGKEDELLGDIEKIAESAFLMVVVFSLAVTKYKLNSKLSTEARMETSVSILVSFSCVEYFRRMRLPEYMDTIRGVVVGVQESEIACNSFVESMPSYANLTNPQEFLHQVEYRWFKDEVQTARILFYLRVIPTCVERLPGAAFSRVVAPTMFLYMGHPNGKVARASHSMFVAFISLGKGSDENERALLKEQLAFYYMQRSLEGYPGITPFEGMASGVAALVRNLPAGSPATFYCIHSIVEKENMLLRDSFTQEADLWKHWQGESEPCKKILELLLRLISLVDIQVLPNLMKLLAQLIIKLPKDGQNVVLNELYAQVADSDDVTRKPTLVSWLQSVSYLCSQAISRSTASKKNEGEENSLSLQDPSDWDRINARL
ncbi:uncharacterized protein LOC8275519 [Ricinus communis]|uniref:Uncharacterized protein n=1 Tax=Ricinus communis TaxID=3988 RepID=B9RL45_RICCO|nr:uncharacterized protein LOC8275519 [Ricinus communis]XP_015571887.1 uncharacterized protein LOC8275519 [Ricinus communis]XP_025012303.1 uncharacterized protein LOC8275519 [Ricinus communis]EEF47960.1 conserved hypothetical protein [Ricinus communis]|eukprot:XP_002514464.1 uncharacterized protein LOC8275519 [Ricinus communis]